MKTMENKVCVKEAFKDVCERIEKDVIKEFKRQFPSLNTYSADFSVYHELNLKDYSVFILYYDDDEVLNISDTYWCIFPHDTSKEITFEKEGTYESLYVTISNREIKLCNVLRAHDSENTSGISLKSYRKQIKKLICDMIMKDEIEIDIFSDEKDFDYSEDSEDFTPFECTKPVNILNTIIK